MQPMSCDNSGTQGIYPDRAVGGNSNNIAIDLDINALVKQGSGTGSDDNVQVEYAPVGNCRVFPLRRSR